MQTLFKKEPLGKPKTTEETKTKLSEETDASDTYRNIKQRQTSIQINVKYHCLSLFGWP